MAAASPWDALLKPPPRRGPAAVEPCATEAKEGTKVASLLAELAARDSATTLTLSVCADLTARQVWGLLKGPRDIGQVRFAAGRWELVRTFAGRDIERAAALLRDAGWRVQRPNVGANRAVEGGPVERPVMQQHTGA